MLGATLAIYAAMSPIWSLRIGLNHVRSFKHLSVSVTASLGPVNCSYGLKVFCYVVGKPAYVRIFICPGTQMISGYIIIALSQNVGTLGGGIIVYAM